MVNYRTRPEIWGEEARRLTPDERDFGIVINVSGNQSSLQSLAAVQVDGVLLEVGQVGEEAFPKGRDSDRSSQDQRLTLNLSEQVGGIQGTSLDWRLGTKII